MFVKWRKMVEHMIKAMASTTSLSFCLPLFRQWENFSIFGCCLSLLTSLFLTPSLSLLVACAIDMLQICASTFSSWLFTSIFHWHDMCASVVCTIYTHTYISHSAPYLSSPKFLHSSATHFAAATFPCERLIWINAHAAFTVGVWVLGNVCVQS